MIEKNTVSRRIFVVVNYVFLGILALVCFSPFVHLAAVSLSNKAAAAANMVTFWPIGFNTYNYAMIMQMDRFRTAFAVSLLRVVVGTAVNMTLTMLSAYVLSRETTDLKGRNFLMWYFVVPMLFSGGLIPTYLIVRDLRLLDNFFALILPAAVPIWNVIMMMNFFRGLPRSLYEVAMLDGAGHPRILFQIFVPISMASMATMTLFCLVNHWNAWFDGMIYINNPDFQPLQTYIHHIVENGLNLADLARQGDYKALDNASNESLKAAQVFIAALPIVITYPFLQKYFIAGITVGSVKG